MKNKSLFNSIRKPLAPPTKLMQNRRNELMAESIEMDNEDYLKFAVDIPDANKHEWENIAYFDTREEAIKFCKERFGSDDEGNINLITEI